MCTKGIFKQMRSNIVTIFFQYCVRAKVLSHLFEKDADECTIKVIL